jgi:hypothetical protein
MWPEFKSSGSPLAEYAKVPSTMTMTAAIAHQTRITLSLGSIESGHASPSAHARVVIGSRHGYHSSIRIQETLAGILPLMTDVVVALGICGLHGRAGHQRSIKRCENDLTHSYLHLFRPFRSTMFVLNFLHEVRLRAAVDSADDAIPIRITIN